MKRFFKYIFLFMAIFVLNISCINEQKHYESHKTEINELVAYFNRIVPQDKNVAIEFENQNHLFFFHITDIVPVKKNDTIAYYNWKTLYSGRDIDIENIPDSILLGINWDKQKIDTLKNKFEKAGCISISNRNPIEIGYKRVFMGMSSYYFFKNYTKEKLIEIREKRTDLHFISDSVAWDYETGAL